ncbi:MAG: UDP-N-acetylmuramoyl-L-alanyl-D-glutamate--2,6-diaminopimelate ligase, partial [Chloroflexi bacterium]|nr:UDP-N-acetylmuramoyl-L-alanyl-D-glutamate--2,6-diaminopimelate ligase [Chloroflexota bacterium]
MGLGELADVIGPERVVGVPVGEITALAYDSRHVAPGTLFFAIPGDHVDGHDFIGDAVARGARAVVAERESAGLAVPQLLGKRARDALADAADAWFGRPSERLEVIGVTGTDGKTTTSYLAVAALQ